MFGFAASFFSPGILRPSPLPLSAPGKAAGEDRRGSDDLTPQRAGLAAAAAAAELARDEAMPRRSSKSSWSRFIADRRSIRIRPTTPSRPPPHPGAPAADPPTCCVAHDRQKPSQAKRKARRSSGSLGGGGSTWFVGARDRDRKRGRQGMVYPVGLGIHETRQKRAAEFGVPKLSIEL